MFFKGSKRFLLVLNREKKKNLLALSVLSTGAILGQTAFLISCASGFLLAKRLGSKETGKRSKIPSLAFCLAKYKIHLHHWLISTVVMAAALFKGPWLLPSELFYGFLSGIALQGIYCYADWHRIVTSVRAKLPPLEHVLESSQQKWDILSSKLLDASYVASPVPDSAMNNGSLLSSDGT
jgi:hypothetical protein